MSAPELEVHELDREREAGLGQENTRCIQTTKYVNGVEETDRNGLQDSNKTAFLETLSFVES